MGSSILTKREYHVLRNGRLALSARGKHEPGGRPNPQGIEKLIAAAIAGIIFSVLLITSELLIWLSTPVYSSESASDVISHSKTTSLALNLLPFAGLAFLWFIAVVREDALEDRFFATVFLGSGLLYLAMSFTSGAIAGTHPGFR